MDAKVGEGVSIEAQVKDAIEQAIEGATAEVAGGGGHFEIRVVSKEFEGKTLLQKQRMVYKAIAHLMNGDAAPVHAVDKLETVTP